MNQDDFRDELTGRCKKFKEKNEGQALCITNVEDQETYDFYRNIKCAKGNIYATYCEYCAKHTCLYYDPEVNLVPKGQSNFVIMNKIEATTYLKNKV